MGLLVDPVIPASVVYDLRSCRELPGVAVDSSLPPVKMAERRGVLEPVAVPTLPAYQNLGWEGAPTELLTRPEVNERLVLAERSLPDGFGLTVLDAWRPVDFQRRLLDIYSEEGDVSSYVADPSSVDEIPPHTTGGAVDITLSWNSVPLRIGSDFDEFTERSWLDHYEPEGRDETARLLRRLIVGVLAAHGFAPDQFEWWHFSLGDQAWARQFGLPHALFGPIKSAASHQS